MEKMNKKASISTYLNEAFIYAIIAFVVFVLVLGSGGASALTNIGAALGKIPSWGWIIIGVLFLFSMTGGKRR